MTVWRDLVPTVTAICQEAWERRQAILRMRDLGFSFHEIAMRFGHSEARSRYLVREAKRDRRRGGSPIQRWMTYGGRDDLEALAKLVKARRR